MQSNKYIREVYKCIGDKGELYGTDDAEMMINLMNTGLDIDCVSRVLLTIITMLFEKGVGVDVDALNNFLRALDSPVLASKRE